MRSPSRFFYGWVVVATAALGLFLGAFPIVVFSFGVFAASYAREFHAGRASVSLAFTLHNLFAGFFAVFIGRLCDRLGARRVILPGLAILSLLMISAEAIGSKIWQLYVFYAALGAVDDATTSVPYALVVSRWFNRHRGLALGLMMLGLGAGSVIVPPVAQQITAAYGWRTAFVAAGGAIPLIAIPMVGWLLRESPRHMGLLPNGASEAAEATNEMEGLTWREIRGSETFWLIIGAFTLLTASVQACIVHLPQLLMDRGASAGAAALAVSIAGFAVMAGRFVTGCLLDHIFGPHLASFLFAIAAFGIAALWGGATGLPALVSGFLVGFGFGAEMDILAYLMGRYFGLRSLGTAFGFGFGVLVVSGGLGPLIMGFGFDHTGSYRAPLGGFFIATVAASVLLSRLGALPVCRGGENTSDASGWFQRGSLGCCITGPCANAAPAVQLSFLRRDFMATQTVSQTTPLHVLRMTEGLIVHHSLCAAAKLGIADLLRDGARGITQLAAKLQVNDDALYRTLRFLAGQGVFEETPPRKFANNELSQWLRSDIPGSVRSMLIYRGTSYYSSSLGSLLYSIESGTPAQQKASGMEGFEYLRHDPELGRLFDEAMTGNSLLWAPAIAAGYDFGRWGSLMDVGGGNGVLLATIMQAYPALQGALADQPQVLERARQREFWSQDLAGRVRFEPMDFFETVPSGCRAYLMKCIIHDWNDERARRILLNCRRAVPDDGVLLLVEYCLGGENAPSVGKAIDMAMLTITGGKERTVSEHCELLASAGFRLSQTIPLTGDNMIIEAKPI